MAEFAALPLFTDSWIADTAHLTRIERGLYFDLIVLMWRTPECRVPNDMAWLMRRLQCAENERETLSMIIEEFTVGDGNFRWQKRLKKEFDYVRKNSKKQSVAAKSRWNKDKKHATAYAEAMPEQESWHGSGNAPTPTPTPTPTPIEVDRLSSAREASETLERQLREAAGWQSEPSPGLCVTGEIEALISAGAILEIDVLPVVRAIALKARSRTTWRFFVPAIIGARDARIAALTAVSPPSANGNYANGTSQQKPPLSPRQAHLAKLRQRAVDAKLREIGEGGDSGGPDIQGPAGSEDGKPGLPGRPH